MIVIDSLEIWSKLWAGWSSGEKPGKKQLGRVLLLAVNISNTDLHGVVRERDSQNSPARITFIQLATVAISTAAPL